MPHVRLANGLRVADPGGDPAAGHAHAGHGAASSGGFAESNGVVVSTQVAGWRQRLVDGGGATVTT